MIKMIWAQTKDCVIGLDNKLPWSIKEEMQHFKQTTTNSNVLMGSKTFESMNKKALPNRVNYILTRDARKYKDIANSNLIIVSDKDSVVKKFKNNPKEDLYIIGGSEIYSLFFEDCDEIIRTVIKKDFKGNVYIKNFNMTNFDKINIVEKNEFYIEYWKKGAIEMSKPKKEKLKLSFWKMTYMWWPMWRMMKKAKKINKKNLKSPGYYSEEYTYNFVKKAAKRILYVSNITVKCEGLENWIDRGVVLVPNHQSNFDPVALLALNNFYLQQPLAFIAKKELWEDKKFGRFVRLIDCIPIDRNNPRSALVAFKEGKELIVDYKRSLVIFPEGTRSHSQEVGEFQPAALKVAQMANAPVIPVTVINSYQVFSSERPKHIEIKVVFGKPIMPNKHIALKTETLTNNVRKAVIENMEKFKDTEMTLDHKTISKINLKNKEELLDYKKENKPKKDKKLKDIFKVVD